MWWEGNTVTSSYATPCSFFFCRHCRATSQILRATVPIKNALRLFKSVCTEATTNCTFDIWTQTKVVQEVKRLTPWPHGDKVFMDFSGIQHVNLTFSSCLACLYLTACCSEITRQISRWANVWWFLGVLEKSRKLILIYGWGRGLSGLHFVLMWSILLLYAVKCD